MAKSIVRSGLTAHEKAIAKALFAAGERSQDIHALLNIGRTATLNFGRLSPVKKDGNIQPASESELRLFKLKKQKFDHVTGLCLFEDERLVRAREAMLLAVELFNTPRVNFKASIFAVLANIAWTYLLHEYYIRRDASIVSGSGWSASLSTMLERADCPLPHLVKKNLTAIKKIRDSVEHHTIGPFDKKWVTIVQACCLNFEKYLTRLFGERSTLGNELGLTLQFSKLSTEEISVLQSYELPPHLAALDASLSLDLEEGEASGLEYQFKVVYTLQSATKGSAHFQFVQPGSAEGKAIHNVLTKIKIADELYPHKPSQVIKEVTQRLPARRFTSDTHRRAWSLYKVRPLRNAKDPKVTKKEFCIYHEVHKDYTYSDAWIDFLSTELADDAKWRAIRNFK